MENSNERLIKDNKDKLFMFNGATNLLEKTEEAIEQIKEKISELFNIKNLNFLFGAGTSSNAIPTMKELKTQIKDKLTGECKKLFDELDNDGKNLEEILEILYSGKAYFRAKKDNEEEKIKNLIKIIQKYIFDAINVEIASKEEVLGRYKNFYQRVTYRNKDLNRVNVFTTNNDLFNEYALDYLNIDYNNGFGGGMIRTFNPARFEYIFTRKIDEGIEKYEPRNHMVYLYKLHGSISWVVKRQEECNSFFDIQEIYPSKSIEKKECSVDGDTCLIYPTPLKEGKSLTSPYTDLIREFQKKLSLPNSVLFIIGYSFSDEHINNIIYRALASNNSLSIVIFAHKDTHKNKPLFKIEDKRIYIIYGKYDDKPIYYFEYFVDNFIPEQKYEDNICEEFIKSFKGSANTKSSRE